VQQEKAAREIFGQDFVDTLKTQAVKRTEDLEAAGVSTKEVEVKETDIDMDKLAEALSKQFDVNIAPIIEGVKELGALVKELTNRVDKIENVEKVKQNNELPRWQFNLVQRATESEDTEVKDSDPLKDAKPQEQAAAKGAGTPVSSRFFNS
jgi:uncharacterized protein (DUF1786 family)